ncbi:hypothetical protein CSIM01_04201 [Colletotrichum simmondsii]|uniref:Uncharacterized protein n=1 Tax=Colletotrichum simmondsii TaxID=703756 RepID=A0A135RP99_9PEZI|nr:hypothetical protein CSIM01_04201 [Colletotrichum simmondsii]
MWSQPEGDSKSAPRRLRETVDFGIRGIKERTPGISWMSRQTEADKYSFPGAAAGNYKNSPILANHVVRVLFLLEQQHRHHTQFLRGRKGRATHAYWGVPVAACATRLDESRGEQQSRKRRAAPLHPACPLGSELFPSDSSREPLWRCCPSPSLKQERSPA